MDSSTPKNEQAISWWISSLAISIICCAVLFVIFASYITDLKSTYSGPVTRIEILEQRQREMLATIENLQRKNGALAPASATLTVPGMTPSATPPMMPPAASDSKIPEVMPSVTPPAMPATGTMH